MWILIYIFTVTMIDFSPQLRKYMPEEAATIISRWINDTGCLFKISRTRKTKLGDYTAPFRNQPHKISVNHDLNPYAFLITTVHEFAHLQTWQQHKSKVKPHGTEWKENFKELMNPFLKMGIFPADVQTAVSNYMDDPAASSCTDVNLYRALRLHDKDQRPKLTIDAIPENSIFSIKGGRVFQKKEKLRTRYKCLEIKTNRMYLFQPIAEIALIESPAEGKPEE